MKEPDEAALRGKPQHPYIHTAYLDGGESSPRILVCIGTSPYGEELVRLAHQMAVRQHAPWHAAYVEIRRAGSTTSGAQTRVWSALRLAESLGATTSILTGQPPTEAILTYARENGITQIVIGNSLNSPWRRILGLSAVDQLLRRSPDIDLHIVSHAGSFEQASYGFRTQLGPAWHYLAALGLVALATVVGLPVRGLTAPANFITTYLLALVVAAVYLGFSAAALTALAAVLAFDFFYLPPYYRLALSDWANLVPLVAFLVIGGVISTLVRQSRRQARAARQREARTHVLFLLSRDLAASTHMSAMLEAVIQHWCRVFGGQAAVVLATRTGGFEVGARSPKFELSEAAISATKRVYQQALSNESLPPESAASAGHDVVLRTAHGVVGVLTARWGDSEAELTPEQERVMEVFANQAALAIERVQFASEAQEAEVLRATEVLQTALLNSVSHDLRTPLSSITGVLSTLYEGAELLDQQTQHELIGTALTEARRLNQLVGDLLDMSRIEAGALRLTQDLNEVQDLVGTTLVNLEPALEDRVVDVQIPDDLPLVLMDFVLMSRVLHNLVVNADKYALDGTPVTITAERDGGWLEMTVADQGPGVPPQDLECIFDKFYRSSRQNKAAGHGLGLAICRGIVDAHGGYIWAENGETGGLRVRILLPLSGTSLDLSDRRNGGEDHDG